VSDYDTDRVALLEQVERDERELETAVDEVRAAVTRPIETVERIVRNPLPWLLSGVLIGLWFGARDDDSTASPNGWYPWRT